MKLYFRSLNLKLHDKKKKNETMSMGGDKMLKSVKLTDK